MNEVMPGRHDPEAILARLPPNLSVEKVAITIDDPSRLSNFVARQRQTAPEATWEGSQAALAALGVESRAAVEDADLERAMQGLGARSDQVLRAPGRVTVRRDDAFGQPRKQKVTGLLNLSWELAAPPAVTEAWGAGGPEQRAELERSLREAATAALEVVTSTTQPSHGFVSTIVLHVVEPEDGATDLKVSGVAVGVLRGKKGKLNSPAAEGAFRPATARRAEDAAKVILDRSLERERGRAEERARRGEEAVGRARYRRRLQPRAPGSAARGAVGGSGSSVAMSAAAARRRRSRRKLKGAPRRSSPPLASRK